jgi:hypothetical protein
MDLSKREEVVAYLVQKATYPMWSKAGVWFRSPEGERVEEPQSSIISEALDLSDKEQCDTVRKELRSRVERERTYVPIREWAVEERPREQLARRGADTCRGTRPRVVQPIWQLERARQGQRRGYQADTRHRARQGRRDQGCH